MKNIKYLLVMIVAVMAFVSCDNDDDDDIMGDPALVGQWVYTEVDLPDFFSVTLNFDSDLRGFTESLSFIDNVEFTQINSFTYSTNGDQLTLVIDGETEVSTYSISGNLLTIDDTGDVIIFTKQ
jgi:hypothetical protein